MRVNHLGQPIGPALDGWTVPPAPRRAPIEGRYCRLQPLDADVHAQELFAAGSLDRDGRNWTYLPYGPFENFEEYRSWLSGVARHDDPLFFAVIDGASRKAVGLAAYLRIDRTSGVIEVGHLNYSPLLQASRAATEAMYLMMRSAFELGYRRYEWKCDALNEPSRRAALRLGFTYEGTFRQAVVVKGRSRDTAWYSIVDTEWPAIKQRLEAWLAPENFDDEGRQRSSLSAMS